MKKCYNCNSSELIEGIVQTTDALKLVFVDKEEAKKIIPKFKKIKAYRCKECGSVSFYVEEKEEK